MKRYSMISLVVALCCVGVAALNATPASAQCNTCPQPVVAFSPVVPATSVVTLEPYRGWYPGRFFDNMRMRRWGYSAPTTVTTAFAPTWSTAVPVTAAMPITTNFVPQTVGFAPMATTTFATPYVTAYAPLGQRQVLMRPVVVQSPVMATSFVDAGCSTCAAPAPCAACSACEAAAPCSSCAGSTVVEQATYAAAAPCTSCAQGSSITYADSGTSSGSPTPQPQLTPQEAAPLQSNYPETTSPQNTQKSDPGPAAEQKPSDSSTYLEPPALFIPGDRTAQQETAKPVNRAPSVNVWNAVYREPVNADKANVSTGDTQATGRSQAEIDAAGWSSVPAN